MTERIFYLLLRQDQKQDKKREVQLFLTHLLMPLVLSGWPSFCLVLGVSVGLIIGEVECINKKVTIDFSGWLQ